MNGRNKINKNLFICYTRLQLMIAEKIIETELGPDDIIECIYLNSSFDPLSLPETSIWCRHTTEFIEINMLGSRSAVILQILNNCLGYRCKTVYLASIENFFVHLVLSRIQFRQLCTFDDGTGNVDPSSVFYVKKKMHFLKRFVKYLLRINYDLDIVKSLSTVHYTVFRSPFNIIQNTKMIDFSPSQAQDIEGPKNRTVSVFLGTVFSELSDSNWRSVLSWCKNHLSEIDHPKYYIPHPREPEVRWLDNFSTVDGPVSAEEAIFYLLKRFENVVVYGFMNTTQILFADNKRVVCKVFEISGVSNAEKIYKQINFLSEVTIIEIPSSNN